MGQIKPAAVPGISAIAFAPIGISACLRLFSGINFPRLEKRPFIRSTISVSRTSSTPINSATTSRVRSSCVGPSPPVTIRASDLLTPAAKTSNILSGLSPTTV